MVNPFSGGEPAKSQSVEKKATQLLPETVWGEQEMPSGTPPENSVVVTISRQFGSGGSDIARLVAAQANLTYLDQQILVEVAQRLGIEDQEAVRQDEQTRGRVGHILQAIRASTPLTMNYQALADSTHSRTQVREFTYFQLTQRVILEVATQGNAVIVGRGSQFLLHNAPRTLHIFVFAPLPYRIENIMKEFGLNRSMAQQMIEQRDYEQNSYLRRYYGNDGNLTSLYHLLINTSLFSFAQAADLIHQAFPVIANIV